MAIPVREFESEELLTSDARKFITDLHRRFNQEREALLLRRAHRQAELDRGKRLDFLADTAAIRASDWKVAPTAHDLEDRKVEITGPADCKMMINALNSGASTFMADLEDSFSPTWANVLDAQQNLRDAVRRKLSFTSAEGKHYKLGEKVATLLVRPRGWHLEEKHFLVDNVPVSASLFDFGLYLFHNAHELVDRGTGPYFYLPKLENHFEARLWNDVFTFAQEELGIRVGTIRATVLIETITAAFEMEEILYELREHAAGLNAGRWDYLFSAIKKFRNASAAVFPDRSQLSMTVPFMRAYTELLVQTCHRRGAHAMGGMAAFIPSRKDAAANRVALAKVREDKEREARDGFDGTWVAHPDLVPVAREIFDRALEGRKNQKHRLREDLRVTAADLLTFSVPGGQITEKGLRNNISVALQYIERWLAGLGAVAINNLMEDAATAEISRAQLWQWIARRARLDDGRAIDAELYKRLRDEELAKLTGDYQEAVAILDSLVLTDNFTEFLTIPAYQKGIH